VAVLVRIFLVLLGSTAFSQTLAVDLDGNPIKELESAATRVVVLFFAASDCPISNRYVPEIQRLEKKFRPQGVLFWLVYPNPNDTVSVVRTHNQQFAIIANTALDRKQTLVQMAHVTVTPEAAVFVSESRGLREVYHGRIDDRYMALGKERPNATHHDLEDAIRAVLADVPIPQSETAPTGCSIVHMQP
jgi:thiol-disulfide isomerase/thioredoxin